ncbi:hypothetical protein [Candidatus Regiella insecticola]|nr:hypothetical protein [Candidatus Regiella insecticola]
MTGMRVSRQRRRNLKGEGYKARFVTCFLIGVKSTMSIHSP